MTAPVAMPRPERLIVAITSVERDARMRRALIALLDHPADVRREERQAAALDECAAWIVFHLKPCKWIDDGEKWDTDCDNAHLFCSGGPVENQHAFCPYCGRRIEVAS